MAIELKLPKEKKRKIVTISSNSCSNNCKGCYTKHLASKSGEGKGTDLSNAVPSFMANPDMVDGIYFNINCVNDFNNLSTHHHWVKKVTRLGVPIHIILPVILFNHSAFIELPAMYIRVISVNTFLESHLDALVDMCSNGRHIPIPFTMEISFNTETLKNITTRHKIASRVNSIVASRLDFTVILNYIQTNTSITKRGVIRIIKSIATSMDPVDEVKPSGCIDYILDRGSFKVCDIYRIMEYMDGHMVCDNECPYPKETRSCKL